MVVSCGEIQALLIRSSAGCKDVSLVLMIGVALPIERVVDGGLEKLVTRRKVRSWVMGGRLFGRRWS